MKDILTSLDGRTLKLTNLNKVFYPDLGISKAEVIQYYLDISEFILPYLYNRPLTLIRYPDGILGKSFYTKNIPDHAPEWLSKREFHDIRYMTVDGVSALIYMINLGGFELHPMNGLFQNSNGPDTMIFDLDPSEDIGFDDVKEMAFNLKYALESMGYVPFVKTSGGKGLHIYVPLVPIHTIEHVINEAKIITQMVSSTYPKATLSMSKEKRMGKILIDIYRNHSAQTCIAPLSLRAKTSASVSMPILWVDVEKLQSAQDFTIYNAASYIKEKNPWQNYFKSAISLIKRDEQDTKSNKQTSTFSPARVFLPMLATQHTVIPSRLSYFFEIKWDGIRVNLIKNDADCRVISKSGKDISIKFPEITKSMAEMTEVNFVIDAEIVSMDQSGKPIFAQVVSRLHSNAQKKLYPVTCYAFDLLWHNGDNLMSKSIELRRKLLEQFLEKAGSALKFSETFEDGEGLFAGIKNMGMEGIIAKKKGSPYLEGVRNDNWIKVKVRNTMDCKIIGYTKGNGDRASLFGALHLGQIHENGKIQYFGKVGSGFNQQLLKDIFQIISDLPKIDKPIAELVEEESNTIWVSDGPDCEVQYASLTPNGTLREPVFTKMTLAE
ncbi:MAG: non-homologous end-joining DNA ligase [Saprospiraceae bacterium]